jgi:protein TonB
MLKHIYANIQYPESSRLKGITGTSVVTFVIEKDGSITGVRTVRFVSGPIDAEAIRVVRNMPAWRPGYQYGKPVRVQFNLPIAFRLQ